MDGRQLAPHACAGIEARYQRIWNCTKPTIARVQGTRWPAGCYLQLLCDISVAADDAVLGHPAVKMGGVSSMPLWQVALGLKRRATCCSRAGSSTGAKRSESALSRLPSRRPSSTRRWTPSPGTASRCRATGAMQNKEALNTALEIMGVGALFRYHGQMNALGRLRERQPDDGFNRFRRPTE